MPKQKRLTVKVLVTVPWDEPKTSVELEIERHLAARYPRSSAYARTQQEDIVGE